MLKLPKKLQSIKLSKKHTTALVILIAVWFLYGSFFNQPKLENTTHTKTTTISTISVPVETKIVHLHLNGIIDTQGNIHITPETSGQVKSVTAKKGDHLKKGDTIALIDTNDKEAKLAQAKAALKQRNLEYNSTLSLHKQEFEAQASVAASLAALKSAELAVESAQIALKNCHITSPIDGVLDQIAIKEGMIVNNNTVIARIIKCDDYIVKSQIPEKNIHKLDIRTAQVILQKPYGILDGTVTSIALEANNKTHGYETEISLPSLNKQCHNIIGMTTDVILNLYETPAYKIPSYAFSLSDQGILGVKTINQENIVEFKQIELLEEDQKGYFWCSIDNAQEELTIIAKGHTYVQSGDKAEIKP